jgi:hypothetical protein
MKKLFILLAIFSTVATTAQSVGINADGSAANASAMLDISSTTKGFLPPRMTYAQRQTITSPAIGLMIFCTNCGPGTGEPQFYNGSAWVNMIGGTALTQPPTVGSTTAASNIGRMSATSGGNITNDFGNTISARGVCWSTSANPTTANSKTTESGTTGLFTSNITGLNTYTLYYIRAYATNASGTSYGNQVTVTTADYAIGESALGGKIAYLLQPGDPGYDANITHGLVASNADISTGAEWGCQGTRISGADGTAIRTGYQNTIDIMAGCETAGIAARLCVNLGNANTYIDWYLPSKDELNKLHLNQVAIGGFADAYYWSSTEWSNELSYAWKQNFGNGQPSADVKYVTHRVRAVRAF